MSTIRAIGTATPTVHVAAVLRPGEDKGVVTTEEESRTCSTVKGSVLSVRLMGGGDELVKERTEVWYTPELVLWQVRLDDTKSKQV